MLCSDSSAVVGQPHSLPPSAPTDTCSLTLEFAVATCCTYCFPGFPFKCSSELVPVVCLGNLTAVPASSSRQLCSIITGVLETRSSHVACCGSVDEGSVSKASTLEQMQQNLEVQRVMTLFPFGMVKESVPRQLLGHFQRGSRDVKASLMLGTGSTLAAGWACGVRIPHVLTASQAALRPSQY